MLLSMNGILYESKVRFSLFITLTSAPSSKKIFTSSAALSNWFSFSNFCPMTSRIVLPFASFDWHHSFCIPEAFSLLITFFISLILRNQFSFRSPVGNNKHTFQLSPVPANNGAKKTLMRVKSNLHRLHKYTRNRILVDTFSVYRWVRFFYIFKFFVRDS